MGKVKGEVSEPKPTRAPKPKAGGGSPGTVAGILAALFSAKPYKPRQGRNIRLYTAVGFGLLALGAVWQASDAVMDSATAVRLGVPAGLFAALAWVIFRIVHYPPFAEFLIATEGEMNKVSWTSKEDLYQSTLVVLSTVLILAAYLFVVDWFWLVLLRMATVLQFSGGGSFGSTS